MSRQPPRARQWHRHEKNLAGVDRRCPAVAAVECRHGCSVASNGTSVSNRAVDRNTPGSCVLLHQSRYDARHRGIAVKTDLPLAGKYSSDEQTVMLRQVQMAKRAGLRGFIVSWKSTDKLNRRLQQLADIAAANDFKLVVIYQGLDFNRNPLAEARVATDLDYFISTFSAQPAFPNSSNVPRSSCRFVGVHSRPDQAARHRPARDKILLLASEKNVKGIQRLAGLVDGDAYYWSSVDPDTYAKYQQKLDSMSDTADQGGGLGTARPLRGSTHA